MKIIAATAFAVLFACPVAACPIVSREDTIKRLADQYSETLRFMAINQAGSVVEGFVSESGSWTLILTTPNGVSCFAAGGEAFEFVMAPPVIGDPT